MKMLFALMVLASFAQAQQPEPLQFHGVSLGQPVAAFADCSTGKPLSGVRAPKKPKIKELCASGQGFLIVGSKSVGTFRSPEIDADIAGFNGGRVFSICLFMRKQAFDNVVADMTAKLGRDPDSTEPKVLQNRSGEKWTFEKAVWKGDVEITVEEMANNSVPPSLDSVMVSVFDTKNIPTEQRVSSLDR